MLGKTFQSILLLSYLLLTSLCYSLPLSTNNRWIIDAASGRRVKLMCVNWASHLQPMLAEGLDKKLLADIAATVAKQRFNCVRLTWATFMFTRARYANLTVAQSLDSLKLRAAKAGIAKHNPLILNKTLVEAYETVVDELGAHGVMVLLDNHVSKPKWCCVYTDGNGFFGDSNFHSQEWLHGLIKVAKHFKSKPQVVAMSLRNELRGSRQNVHDWYIYIHQGARSIHKANPNVLVLVSGLTWGTDLSFLKNHPLALNLHNKLVYETHWYSFSGDPRIWVVQPVNRICANAIWTVEDQTGFVINGRNPVPLFLGEFGFDQRGVNRADNRFLTCLMAYAASRDLDWGLWALQGSYYLNKGIVDQEDTYSVLDYNWAHLRNPKFHERFQLMQRMIQDPNSNLATSYIMYHPLSGSCISSTENNDVQARECRNASRWTRDRDGAPIRLMGSALCLKAVGNGLAPILSTDCLGQQSAWKFVSKSKFHIAAKDEQGKYLCLHKHSSNSSRIVTRRCICVTDDSACQKNPQSQWFNLISINVK